MSRQKNKKISIEEFKYKLIEIGHWLDTQKNFFGPICIWLVSTWTRKLEFIFNKIHHS